MKRRLTLAIEYLGKSYRITPGDSLTVDGEDHEALFTIELLESGVVRLHPGNAYWENRPK